jgi:ABC-2 type transport system ATP-binding protein
LIASYKNVKIEDLEIYTDNLTKIYTKGQKAIKAVDHINLRIEPGIHGFLGPNGAGKTTTINMLIGAISISGGVAKIRGYDIGSLEAQRLIGFLPQEPAYYENMTASQYLMFVAQLNGLRRAEAKEKVNDLIKLMDLTEAKDKKVGKYSGGMKQKVGIASALIHDPKILILDEPTANLDPIGRAELIKTIKKLSKKTSIFISSHILSEIEQMCERVTMINNGKIVLSDTIKKIKEIHKHSINIFVLNTNSNNEILQLLKTLDYIVKAWISEEDGKVYIIPDDIDAFQMIIPKLLAENNLMLKDFFLKESTLQDIFIEVMEGEE